MQDYTTLDILLSILLTLEVIMYTQLVNCDNGYESKVYRNINII